MFPITVARGLSTLDLITWKNGEVNNEPEVLSKSQSESRVCIFSDDGSLFAYCDGLGVDVIEMSTNDIKLHLNLPRTLSLKFSPCHDILCTWENFSNTRESEYGKENLRIFSVASGNLLHSYILKQSETVGLPQWFSNTNECAILKGNTVNFYENNNFTKVTNSLHVNKLSTFSLSPNEQGKQHIAAFIRGSKGAPSSVRLFARGAYDQSDLVSNKSFYKADKVDLRWNKRGSAILVIAMLESDTTGQSYYGEQNLYFLSTNGESSRVSLSREGPVYDAVWSPKSNFFCVVYGFMPSKTSFYNMKCDPIFEFEQVPRNQCFFNPHGNLVALCGFGNLRGTIEVWDVETKKEVSTFSAPDTTLFEWCSDGSHFITATTTPRLRVNNGFKIWNYLSGELIERKWEKNLFHVCWQPLPHEKFPAPSKHANISKPVSFKPKVTPAKYVPPNARGRQDYSTKIKGDDEDKVIDKVQMGKNAVKNMRKRNNKKQQQQQQQQKVSTDLSSEQQDAVKMAMYLLGGENGDKKPSEVASKGVKTEKQKKIASLRKKLRDIEKLKVQQSSGKVLEKNQLVKLQKEDQIKTELEQLCSE